MKECKRDDRQNITVRIPAGETVTHCHTIRGNKHPTNKWDEPALGKGLKPNEQWTPLHVFIYVLDDGCNQITEQWVV